MGTASSKGRVLIVDDQFLIVEFLKIWVETYGFEVCGAARSAAEAVEAAILHRPDYILMDVRLDGGRDGIDAAIEICKSIETRIVYITGSSEGPTIARINEDHPYAILIKPIDPAELGRVLMQGAGAPE
jgi:DNA-binding NarL/FixJ family response regulator